MDFAGLAIDDRDALTGIVDKKLLSRAMALAHDQAELAGPGAIRLAEPAVLEALRRGGLVFLPQQEQGNALAFELVVHRGPVGGQGREGACGWRWRKQLLLQRSRIESVGQGPGQARHLSTLHVGRDGGSAEAQTPGNLPITEPDRPFET